MAKKNDKKVVPMRSRKAKEPAVAPMVSRRESAAPAPAQITAEERAHMIAEAAYYRAEARGFTHGDAIADWLAAEREVDAQISGPARA